MVNNCSIPNTVVIIGYVDRTNFWDDVDCDTWWEYIFVFDSLLLDIINGLWFFSIYLVLYDCIELSV